MITEIDLRITKDVLADLLENDFVYRRYDTKDDECEVIRQAINLIKLVLLERFDSATLQGDN